MKEPLIETAKENQTDRIKSKLVQLKQKDKDFSVSGSKNHKYNVNEKISRKKLMEWERANQVRLPEHFALFLTEVGNGGAGPYYGIYELDEAVSFSALEALTSKCVLYPNMPNEEWNLLTVPLVRVKDYSYDETDAAYEKVMGGMLCIGTQGCEYNMYIVIEGEHKGKVVYTADFYKDSPFFFVYESNFLDWYERWLDENILGYNTTWFGFKMPGDESELIRVYQNAPSDDIKSDALDGMLKFPKMSQTSIDFLKGIADQNQNRKEAIRLICKYSFDDGIPYISEMLKSKVEDKILSVLQNLHWYGRVSDKQAFTREIIESFSCIQEPETLRFAGYVLEPIGRITIEDYEPFLCHPNPEMRKAAIYATRDCGNKAE